MNIDKHFEKHGVELTADNSLPSGQRTQKNVKQLVAGARDAVNELIDELREANERCRAAQDGRILYQERSFVLEKKLARYKLQETLAEIESLSSVDKIKLLEDEGRQDETDQRRQDEGLEVA